jgi:hypothetical protein
MLRLPRTMLGELSDQNVFCNVPASLIGSHEHSRDLVSSRVEGLHIGRFQVEVNLVEAQAATVATKPIDNKRTLIS